MTKKPKSVSESAVQMTEIVLPSHANALGTIFGGQIMAWIDIAAAIASQRHAKTVCVTASIDTLHFVEPVRVGEVVSLLASVNYTGRTSMEVGVRVDSENPRTGAKKHVASAYLTFVAIDSDGRPTEIAPISPKSAEEKRRHRNAELRRKARLELKKQLGSRHKN